VEVQGAVATCGEWLQVGVCTWKRATDERAHEEGADERKGGRDGGRKIKIKIKMEGEGRAVVSTMLSVCDALRYMKGGTRG
jgi:hypothetical protein